jgi:hypothetical protein
MTHPLDERALEAAAIKRPNWCGISGDGAGGMCCSDIRCRVHEMQRAFFDTSSYFWRGGIDVGTVEERAMIDAAPPAAQDPRP